MCFLQQTHFVLPAAGVCLPTGSAGGGSLDFEVTSAGAGGGRLSTLFPSRISMASFSSGLCLNWQRIAAACPLPVLSDYYIFSILFYRIVKWNIK